MRLGRCLITAGDDDGAEDPAGYPERLAELARTLRGMPWLLAGGLTIPLQLGGFYRAHSDIDVAFPLEAFPDVTRAMERAGYFLSTYFPMSFFGAWRHALSVPVRHDGWLVRRRPRKLRFLDGTGTRQSPHLLSAIDALPYRVVDGCFATCDGRYRFPLVRPMTGHRFTTTGGDEISCLDLHYVTAIKQRLDGSKHALDVSMVARHLPEHVGAKPD
jgi:hypothetical protein